MVRYQIIEQSRESEEIGAYTTYGLEVVGRGLSALVIDDITLDKEKIFTLADRFNREGLSLCHLRQAIEDFLYDFEI